MNMHVGALKRAQDSLPEGLLAQERAREKALKKLRRLREKAEAEVERLLTFLDAMDGYTTTELEVTVDDDPCDDNELEANLTGLHGKCVPSNYHDPVGDLEADGSDDEPSLGSLQSHGGTQEVWAHGASMFDLEDSGLGNDDREHDPLDDGEGERDDDEPSLGWTVEGVAGDQSGADRELQDHAATDVVKDRARRRKGKRNVRTMDITQNVTGHWRLTNLSEQQRAALDH